jgi:transposase
MGVTIFQSRVLGDREILAGIGALTALTIYAWVGDVRRFPDAKALAAYAGLVPSVRQSGELQRLGSITKTGSKALWSTLVQAAHVLMNRCRGTDARPLQAIGARVHTSRGRRKIAAVALARHLLRIAYYILRDGTVFDPKRLRVDDDARRAA